MKRALDRILGVIENAVDERAGELLAGGQRIGGELAQGYYIEPTVFGNVDNSSNAGSDRDIRAGRFGHQV